MQIKKVFYCSSIGIILGIGDNRKRAVVGPGFDGRFLGVVFGEQCVTLESIDCDSTWPNIIRTRLERQKKPVWHDTQKTAPLFPFGASAAKQKDNLSTPELHHFIIFPKAIRNLSKARDLPEEIIPALKWQLKIGAKKMFSSIRKKEDQIRAS